MDRAPGKNLVVVGVVVVIVVVVVLVMLMVVMVVVVMVIVVVVCPPLLTHHPAFGAPFTTASGKALASQSTLRKVPMPPALPPVSSTCVAWPR